MLEVDGDRVANGGRFVWFNSRLQKVVEIGLSDRLVPMFMDETQYQQVSAVCIITGPDVVSRPGSGLHRLRRRLAITPALLWKHSVRALAHSCLSADWIGSSVFTDENGKPQIEFIECNRRPQVLEALNSATDRVAKGRE